MLAEWGWRGACFGWAILQIGLALPLNACLPSPAAAETAEPDSGQEEGRDAPINPFEALRSRAQNGAPPPERPDRFQPRRIDPADVPPGMRVVSTPFGDRLVEE